MEGKKLATGELNGFDDHAVGLMCRVDLQDGRHDEEKSTGRKEMFHIPSNINEGGQAETNRGGILTVQD